MTVVSVGGQGGREEEDEKLQEKKGQSAAVAQHSVSAAVCRYGEWMNESETG